LPHQPPLTLKISSDTHRTNPQTTITVFINLSEVELWVSGKSIGKQKVNAYATIIWEDIVLEKGWNKLKVKVGSAKQSYTDFAEWILY